MSEAEFPDEWKETLLSLEAGGATPEELANLRAKLSASLDEGTPQEQTP